MRIIRCVPNQPPPLDRLTDERGKRVIFVSHCLLNQNIRYPGGAFRRGVVDELVESVARDGLRDTRGRRISRVRSQ